MIVMTENAELDVAAVFEDPTAALEVYILNEREDAKGEADPAPALPSWTCSKGI